MPILPYAPPPAPTWPQTLAPLCAIATPLLCLVTLLWIAFLLHTYKIELHSFCGTTRFFIRHQISFTIPLSILPPQILATLFTWPSARYVLPNRLPTLLSLAAWITALYIARSY